MATNDNGHGVRNTRTYSTQSTRSVWNIVCWPYTHNTQCLYYNTTSLNHYLIVSARFEYRTFLVHMNHISTHRASFRWAAIQCTAHSVGWCAAVSDLVFPFRDGAQKILVWCVFLLSLTFCRLVGHAYYTRYSCWSNSRAPTLHVLARRWRELCSILAYEVCVHLAFIRQYRPNIMFVNGNIIAISF